jgi:high-affinity nickel-transport protein
MDLALPAGAAHGVGSLALLGTALTLGLRHGIDWDHLAAISDITSSGGTAGTGGAAGGRPAPARNVAAGAVAPGGLRVDARAVWLASLYALGHAAVVVALGVAALSFQTILPDWIDPIMERLVGATLVALGVWVVYSLFRAWRGGGEFRLRSRWMLLFAGLRRAWRGAQTRLHGHAHDGHAHVHPVADVDRYGPRTALGTGLIHGVGAETGTQVLLIAAVGGAASQGLGVAMLLAFVVGLLVSNSAVALLTSAGFVSAGRARGLYVFVGCLTAVFSLAVGSFALLGISDRLPDLQQVIGAVLGQAPI